MKKAKHLSIAVLFFFVVAELQAQNNEESKPYVVHTMYLNSTVENGNVNVDSLLKIYKQRIMDVNPYFVSTKIVRHWWGSDSRQVLFIYELKSWDDVDNAFEKQNAIMQQLKGSDNQAAGKLWQSLFLPEHHSDEIYRVIQ